MPCRKVSCRSNNECIIALKIVQYYLPAINGKRRNKERQYSGRFP
jgi:hypothetical protein